MRASLLAALVFLIAPPAPAQAPALDEIVVTGERSGPNMWHVHKGSAHVWILGSLTPLPRGITWRSHQVESVLGHTNQVLVQKPFEISIPRILWVLLTDRKLLLVTGGKRLKDVLRADLYQRFAVLRTRYTDDDKKWERYRPIVAAAFLEREAFHRVGLSVRLDLGAAVRKLAEQDHVKVEEIKMAGTGDMLNALKTLPASTENTCVEASLATIEGGLPRLLERAQAWADGNTEKLQSLPVPKEVDACLNALDSGAGAGELMKRMRSSWLYAIEGYLAKPGTTIAVVNYDLLLDHGGVLDQLRNAGFEIDAP
ncbi:MAG TPA: TraB/GumN family protein [Steroidobacteraceae bacterium]|nr:TraB/GumN family protein [Steroidobacteraceae bacterium]